MKGWMRYVVFGIATVLLVAACTPAPQAATGAKQSQAGVASSAEPRRITAAIRDHPPSFARTGHLYRGLDALTELTNAGLTHLQADGTRMPQLAEAVPTLDNGLWKLFPDGQMETTWKIKPNAHWQDGEPFTTDDLVFTTTVEQDKSLEIAPFATYGLIDQITAVDPSTVVITWNRPYIEADWMFSYLGAGLPMPKHLLESAYDENKAMFQNLPYWSTDFVGLGPYKVQEWEPDTRVVLTAFDDYILGRPRIDEIEVKFIPDNNTLLANILSGVDLTLGKTISLDMAVGAQDQYKAGKVLVKSQNWTPINPQWINPDPPIISNYQFRKALLLDLDRKQLADSVITGHGVVADSYVNPEEPMYNLVEPSIVKYGYDPRQAAQILRSLGYTKRDDGFLYDADGKKLEVSIQIPLQNDIHAKAAAAVADAWQRLGVSVIQDPLPVQRAQDREFRAQFSGFNVTERVNALDIGDIWNFHSSRVPLPENHFVSSGFASRYINPEVDAALEKYATTIPLSERMAAVAQLVHHQTQNLSEMPLFFGADPTMVSNRLVNVTARGSLYTQAWNVTEWDLTE
jgi:peptide/nickel transport system substrate-binding protein